MDVERRLKLLRRVVIGILAGAVLAACVTGLITLSAALRDAYGPVGLFPVFLGLFCVAGGVIAAVNPWDYK